MKTIHIGNDHRGFRLVSTVLTTVKDLGFNTKHHGCYSSDSADYPTYAQHVAEAIQKNPNDMGVLICGSGIGISIAANRFPGIRAALCRGVTDAEMSRKHNNANVICFGADFHESSLLTDEALIDMFVREFLITRFEGGRHQRRIDLIDGAESDGDEFIVG